MVLKFSVTNHLSIRETQIIDFQTIYKKKRKNDLSENLISVSKTDKIIPVAAFFGANASGKTNLLEVFYHLITLIQYSADNKLDAKIKNYAPFLLDTESENQPTIFNIDFLNILETPAKRYNYQIKYNKDTILEESLFLIENQGLVLIFSRPENTENISFGAVFETSNKNLSVLKNQLYLSWAGKTNIPQLANTYRYFNQVINLPYLSNDGFDTAVVSSILKSFFEKIDKSENLETKKAVLSLLKAADFNIVDVFLDSDENTLKSQKIKFKHAVNIDGEIKTVDLSSNQESTGTRKFFTLCILIINALENGKIFIIDELEKNLHPELSQLIINLFQNPETNPNRAQLIFSSHDTTIINEENLRADQIFLVTKNAAGATQLAKLSEFEPLPKGISFYDWFKKGLFGALPALNEFALELDYLNKNKKTAPISE